MRKNIKVVHLPAKKWGWIKVLINQSILPASLSIFIFIMSVLTSFSSGTNWLRIVVDILQMRFDCTNLYWSGTRSNDDGGIFISMFYCVLDDVSPLSEFVCVCYVWDEQQPYINISGICEVDTINVRVIWYYTSVVNVEKFTNYSKVHQFSFQHRNKPFQLICVQFQFG